MIVSTEKPLIKRLSCHVLPLTFLLWCAFWYLAGGIYDGIWFAGVASLPTASLKNIPAINDTLEAVFPSYGNLLWQWGEIFAYGYLQWFAVNFVLLKGIHFIRPRLANRA